MTTVVDPFGSPSATYNRSGVTIVAVTASGTTQGAATAIPAASGHTVAIVNVDSGNDDVSVLLPSGADIGDVVEVYCAETGVSNGSAKVFPPSGGSIGRFGTNVSASSAPNQGAAFRKVTSTNWQQLGGGS